MQVLQLTPPETLSYRIISGDKPRVGELTQCLPNFTAPTAFLLRAGQKNLFWPSYCTFALEAYRLCLLMSLKLVHGNGHKVIFPTQVCAGFHNDFLSTCY